jgi:NADH-quinone oxidoreductase subunit C/D
MTIIDTLQEKFGEEEIQPQATCDDVPTAWVRQSVALGVLRHLKETERYRMLFDLTAIDERSRHHRRGQPDSDFTVVYHLLSFDRNEDVRLKVALTGEHPSMPSATGLWASANWYEREV